MRECVCRDLRNYGSAGIAINSNKQTDNGIYVGGVCCRSVVDGVVDFVCSNYQLSTRTVGILSVDLCISTADARVLHCGLAVVGTYCGAYSRHPVAFCHLLW